MNHAIICLLCLQSAFSFMLPCSSKSLTSSRVHQKNSFRMIADMEISTSSLQNVAAFFDVSQLSDSFNYIHQLGSVLLSDASEEALEPISYSKYSYYATLGLYVLSFPGLWSVIKRSAKTKYKERVYITAGPQATENSKPVKQVAAEIIAYFQANNYKIVSAGEEIVFEGALQASRSQAFFLVFCTFLCLGTLSLVLQIQFPSVGTYWYLLTLLSPYAGVYYWQNASRNEKAQIRLETSEDEGSVEINITAGEEELDRMAMTMGYSQKGMVRVKGLLETNP